MRLSEHGKRILATLAETVNGRLSTEWFHCVLFGVEPVYSRLRYGRRKMALTQSQRSSLSRTVTRLHANGLIAFKGKHRGVVMLTDEGRKVAQRLTFDPKWTQSLTDAGVADHCFDEAAAAEAKAFMAKAEGRIAATMGPCNG